MLRDKKIISVLISIFYISIGFAQHPDLKAIDSLKKILPATHGIQRINTLNALAEEYWWPPKTEPATIDSLTTLAEREAIKQNYLPAIARSNMLFGVAEIFRNNLQNGEKYLRHALSIYQNLNSDDLGWCYVWLGQSLYYQNSFDESLDCYFKALPFLIKTGDLEAKGKAWTWMAFIYAALGNYDSSFYYCSQSLLLRQRMSDHVCVTASLTNMGQLYKAAGDYEDALDYYKQSFHYANIHGVDLYTANWAYLGPMGTIYLLMNAVDSSYYFVQKAFQLNPANQMVRISFGETLLAKNQPDSALKFFLEWLDEFRKGNDKWDLMRVTMDIAKSYERKKEMRTALNYALESYSLAQKAKARHYLLEGYSRLSKIYKYLSMNDSAYFFLVQYTALKDSILKNQFLWKLSNYKKQSDFKKQMDQLAFLDQQNKEKEQEIKQKNLLQFILIVCLLIAALSAFIIYKNLALKRKNEKLESMHNQAELQQHVTDLEMQALRAQMNPHFIFNCLSSINRFIFKNETEAASNYLTKFSRLIRMALNNSKKPFVIIEDEIEMLSLYLDLEKLRFKDSFDYKISFINTFDPGNVFLPPLLLQPFAENAIWHGLMHKEGKGHLEIELGTDRKTLCCTITDNGIGRAKSAELKSKSAQKQKSMGLHITTERLALLNKNNNLQTFFNIEDIFDIHGMPAGTRVILKINYKELAEVNT
jgi:tetratricopeptide (TPR) repeat protein